MSCVYRLDVTLPKGADAPDWEPGGWIAEEWDDADGHYRQEFKWPQKRHCLSASTARRWAKRLEALGRNGRNPAFRTRGLGRRRHAERGGGMSARPTGPHWVHVTPLDPAIAVQLRVVLSVAAGLARSGEGGTALRLRAAYDEIRRLLTESYPDERTP